jgi:hypothetical protein
MSEELLTGVEMQDDSAAGDQQEEEDIFGLSEDTGEEETQEDAASEEAETGAFEDESKEKAFAARLRKEREKIAQETEERLRQEYEAKYQQIQQQQQTQQQRYIPPSQTPPPLPRQQLEDLADQLGVTIETANAMYHQQWLINQQNEAIRRQEEYLLRMADSTSKSEALKAIEQRRKGNPNLPEPDETRLQQIRQEYKGKYGYDLPWEEAYEKLIAQEAISGNLTRTAQQKVINDITARGRKTVQAGKGGRAKKPSIEDMSKDDFEALVEQAKAGKFKRT